MIIKVILIIFVMKELTTHMENVLFITVFEHETVLKPVQEESSGLVIVKDFGIQISVHLKS